MRIAVVSNRLPIVLEQIEDRPEAKPGSGGLIGALFPILRRWGGKWIGWPGNAPTQTADFDRMLVEFGERNGFEIVPVYLTSEEQVGFYQGFSNEIIWPLFHDLQSRCNFVPDYWTTYTTVTGKFAEVVVANTEPNDFIWVQDYHMMSLGRMLRDRGVTSPIGFFLHIPFPPADIFAKLPWRKDTLESLLRYDTVGFQSDHDRQNFVDSVRRILPTASFRRTGLITEVTYQDKVTRVGYFPIGIDYQEFARDAAGPAVTQRVEELRKEMPEGQIVLSVDRLDYTKGIPQRLKAFQLALKRYPELHRAVTLLQVVIPSRESVPEYQDLKAEIERLVTQVNGEFTLPGWVPIHHVFHPVKREELLAYYRVADVALITPLKDGMNLVAKEYCACQVEGDGVLILSEFAGAAVQFKRDAILVNPYDLDTVADATRLAVSMTLQERQPAMRRLRRITEREDVYWWLDRFLRACGVSHPVDDVQNTSVTEEENTDNRTCAVA